MRGWKYNQKQFLHHWRKRRIKTGYVALLLIIAVFSNVFLLRRNNLEMIQLRSAVIQADASAGDVRGSLEKLNSHVFKHMNTQIVRPIELVGTYNREAQTLIQEANKTSGRDIYAEATAACERRGIPLTSIAQCAADYATSNNPDVGPKQIVLPDKNLFTYTFASPLWTPDAAGISLVVTVVVLLWLVARIGEILAVRFIVRRRLRNNF